MTVQLYRCPQHGLVSRPAPFVTCPIVDLGEACGEQLEGPIPHVVEPMWALCRAFERLRRDDPFTAGLRQRRIAREEAEIRDDLDYGRD